MCKTKKQKTAAFWYSFSKNKYIAAVNYLFFAQRCFSFHPSALKASLKLLASLMPQNKFVRILQIINILKRFHWSFFQPMLTSPFSLNSCFFLRFFLRFFLPLSGKKLRKHNYYDQSKNQEILA